MKLKVGDKVEFIRFIIFYGPLPGMHTIMAKGDHAIINKVISETEYDLDLTGLYSNTVVHNMSSIKDFKLIE